MREREHSCVIEKTRASCQCLCK